MFSKFNVHFTGGWVGYLFNALAHLMYSGNNIGCQYNMASISLEALALKWSSLFRGGGLQVFHEYLALYMQELGLSLTQISWTSLMGVLQLIVPLFGFLGDRFSVRKLILIVLLLVIFTTTLVPLLPLVVSLPTCFEKHSESSVNATSLIEAEYFDRNLDGQSNISLNGSSQAFLFRRSGELDYRLFQERTRLKTNTAAVKEVKQNNLVPWLSTLYSLMVITRLLFSVTERAAISLINLATITYLKESEDVTVPITSGDKSVAVCPSCPSVSWLRILRSIIAALSAMVTSLHLFGHQLRLCCLHSRYHG